MAETFRDAAPFPGNGQSVSQDKINNVAATAHGAVDKAANTVKPAVDRAATLAHGAVDKAASAAVPAAAWVQEKAEAARATQKQAVETSAEYISSNPFKAIGIAALIGFLIGRLSF
jgi:ElaB/YqjD/DUF883 family membrane-anchored ribosome-binding protein